MRPRPIIAVAVAVLLVSSRADAVRAQAVRGRVVTQTADVVPGAIVTLLDSAGTPLARALADDQGEFAVRLPAPGTYRFQILRLGFTPSFDGPFKVAAGQVLDRSVPLTGKPVPLAAVSVVSERSCLADADSASAAFTVWSEARKALLSSQLTRLTRRYAMDVGLFKATQASDPHQPPIVSRSDLHMEALRPFVTLTPEQLVEQGYVRRARPGEQGDRYFAPDEDVLLSDEFATTHCLRLLPDSGSDNQIRLGFTPVPERRLPDIRGVLTVDRATSELRRLDFSYVNLRPEEMVGSPGGEIDFRRLPEGSWIIEYWALGIPFFDEVVVQQQMITTVPGRGVRAPPPRPPITSVRTGRITTGGGVLRVTFGDTLVWAAPVPPGPRARLPLPPD